MNNTELKKLCESVGRKLTNRPVRVRFQQPAYVNAKGTACKRGRTAYIDILPGMSSKEFLGVLLHELAHVKSLWGCWSGTVPEYTPGSLRVPDYYSDIEEISEMEDVAETLARDWLSYAERHADRYKGDWLVSRLQALAHYLEPRIEEIFDKAVNAAVEKAFQQVRKNWERVR